MGLALLVLAVFGSDLRYGFIHYDDGDWVYANPHVAKGVTWSGIVAAFRETTLGHWAPLTAISHEVVAEFFGLKPWGHHFANIVLHSLDSALVFLSLRLLTGAVWRSAFVAAIFAIHPLRVESVVWVTERKDVLSGVFFLLGIFAYTIWTRAPRPGRYVLVLLLYVCGLMSKSMVLTLPFVLVLLDCWPLGRVQSPRDLAPRFVEKLPLFALAVVAAIVQYLCAKEYVVPLDTISLADRVKNAVVAYATYVGQLFWPTGLAIFYPHPVDRLPLATVAACAAVLLGITVLVLWQRQRPYLFVGWCWFLGMTFPVIGLVQSGEIARADRYTYLPHLGLLIALSWAATDALERWRIPTPVRISLGSGLVALTAFAGHAQVLTWQDEVSFWRRTIAVTERNHHAHINLGILLSDRGDLDGAIAELRQAVTYQPEDRKALINLGTLYLEKERFNEACQTFALAAKEPMPLLLLDGRYALALLKAGRAKEAYDLHCRGANARTGRNDELSFGQKLLETGELDLAAQCFERALAAQAAPATVAAAHSGLGMIRFATGFVSQADQHFRTALEANPNAADALSGRGDVLFQQGAVVEAIDHYRRALAADPSLHGTAANLAWILATSADPGARSPQEALDLARRASAATGDQEPGYLRIVAAALAESGQFDAAIATAVKAQHLAHAQGDAATAQRIGLHLAEYRAGRPLRIPVARR